MVQCPSLPPKGVLHLPFEPKCVIFPTLFMTRLLNRARWGLTGLTGLVLHYGKPNKADNKMYIAFLTRVDNLTVTPTDIRTCLGPTCLNSLLYFWFLKWQLHANSSVLKPVGSYTRVLTVTERSENQMLVCLSFATNVIPYLSFSEKTSLREKRSDDKPAESIRLMAV